MTTIRERATAALRAWVRSWEEGEHNRDAVQFGLPVDDGPTCDFDEKLIAAIVTEFGWRPIDTLPEADQLVLAKTYDKRRMIYRTHLLRSAMRADTPGHLRFPAVAWMEVPE